jgi:hypothetical protein
MGHAVESISLEEALATFERDAAAAYKALSAAAREVKKLQASATVGDLRALRNAADASVRLSDQGAEAVGALRSSWQFDETAYFEGGELTREVLALAEAEGLQAFESDDRILSYPAIVQVVTADMTVLIDKKRDRRIRPSVLVRTLKALQQRPPKFKAEAFLETLASAYDLIVRSTGGRPASTVKLVDLYGVLTLMPGAGREYTKQEFARDLYLLDQSSVVVTRDGRTLALPASALTRGSGVLHTVTRSGQAKVYAGITFEEASS